MNGENYHFTKWKRIDSSSRQDIRRKMYARF